eukprot:3548934-Rhodomonas_salina.1
MVPLSLFLAFSLSRFLARLRARALSAPPHPTPPPSPVLHKRSISHSFPSRSHTLIHSLSLKRSNTASAPQANTEMLTNTRATHTAGEGPGAALRALACQGWQRLW